MTVRDNDGSIVQFTYGDDGIDVMNSKFFDKLKFMDSNHTICRRDIDKLLSSGAAETDAVKAAKHQDAKKAKKVMKADKKLSQFDAICKVSDPLLSRFHPQRHFGVISEKMEQTLQKFKAEHFKESKPVLKQKYSQIDPDDFVNMYYHKYMKSLVHPGENVGTIAAQSIGEPSTQMTLNTFHLAGSGVGNVTLGIPRLKEILMTTPYNIKTPFMTIYFRKDKNLSQD